MLKFIAAALAVLAMAIAAIVAPPKAGHINVIVPLKMNHLAHTLQAKER